VKASPSLNTMQCPTTIALIIFNIFYQNVIHLHNKCTKFCSNICAQEYKIICITKCGLMIHSAVATSFQTITPSFEQRRTFLFLIYHVVVMFLSLFTTLNASYIRYDFEQCVCILKSQFLMVSICLLAITNSCLILT
jgi:hypothetical protein